MATNKLAPFGMQIGTFKMERSGDTEKETKELQFKHVCIYIYIYTRKHVVK